MIQLQKRIRAFFPKILICILSAVVINILTVWISETFSWFYDSRTTSVRASVADASQIINVELGCDRDGNGEVAGERRASGLGRYSNERYSNEDARDSSETEPLAQSFRSVVRSAGDRRGPDCAAVADRSLALGWSQENCAVAME